VGYDWHSQVALWLGVCEFSEFCACKGVLPCKSDFVKSAPKFNNSCSNGVLNDRDPAVRSEINCAHTHNLNGFQTQKLNQSILAFRNEWLWYDPICVVHCSCPMWCWNLSTSLKSSCPSRLHISYHWVQLDAYKNSTNPQVVLPQGQLRCTAFQIRSPRQGARRLKQRAEDSYPSKLYYICYLESQILDVWAVLGVLCLFQSNEEKLYIQDSWMR
jgi:hypothetical protein